MALEIVTGHRGTEHISSGDVQGLLRAAISQGLYVFDCGQHFAAELEGINTVRIHDGELVMQGVHCRIPPGMSDTVSITNGSMDYDRFDVITLKYARNASTGVESVAWEYHQGGADGLRPTIANEGAYIVAGDTEVEVAMFNVQFSGVTPSVYPVFTSMAGLQQMHNRLQECEDAIEGAASSFAPGDTVKLHFKPTAGEVYNNGRTLRFAVPLPKPPAGISSVTVTAGTLFVRGNGSVLKSETAIAGLSPHIVLYTNELMITISRDGFIASSANNSVVTVYGDITVTFA